MSNEKSNNNSSISKRNPKSREKKITLVKKMAQKTSAAQHTDMSNMTVTIDHDVAIVSIFYLDDVTNDRVRCHGLYKIIARALEFGAFF